MISHRGISVITPLPFGEGKGEGPLTHRGISVITPLPFGEGTGEGPAGVGGGAAIFLTLPFPTKKGDKRYSLSPLMVRLSPCTVCDDRVISCLPNHP